MAVCGVFAPCSLAEVYRRFKGVLPPSSGSTDLGGSKYF
jgi:hypothetical protein